MEYGLDYEAMTIEQLEKKLDNLREAEGYYEDEMNEYLQAFHDLEDEEEQRKYEMMAMANDAEDLMSDCATEIVEIENVLNKKLKEILK